MTDAEILIIAKQDLEIRNTLQDSYLMALIGTAKKAIADEGITINADSDLDCQLVTMYAAYLYRKRDNYTGMPRMLRLLLNNRKFRERGMTT